jgi:hypothetical protein
MRQVIGGPVKPPVAGPAPRAVPAPGVSNASLAQASGGTPACFQASAYGVKAASFTYQPASGPHGSGTETVRVTAPGPGTAKLLQVMDLGLCAPSVTSGRQYSAGMRYKSTGPAQIEIYRRTVVGSWVYWTTSPVFAAATSWQKAAWTTPPVPPGTTALSFGLTANSVVTMTTTDYSLTVAKNHRELIFLAVLLVALLAAGLIARGHYRYVRYDRAEAASTEAAAKAAAA